MSRKRNRAAPFAGPLVHLVTNRKQLVSLMQAMNADSSSSGYPRWKDTENAYGVTWTLEVGGEDTYIVGLNMDRLKDAAEIVTTLVHEAVHVKQGWMDSIGEDSPSSEFEAYTVERIVASLMGQFKATVLSS